MLEAALARSYNRWVADRTADGRDRLGWVLVPPTRMMDRALTELEWGKANGAVGVMIKGTEHGLYLDDPYFYPLYAKAQELDLVMCVHSGASLRRVENVPIGNIIPTPAALTDHTATVIKGFWAVATSDFHQRFPGLRWMFAESGSTWIPLVFQQQQRLFSTAQAPNYFLTDRGVSVRIDTIDPAAVMEEKNLYVAVQSDEDLPYLASVAGADRLVFGTDYCHNDLGTDPLGHWTIAARDDLDPTVASKIVDSSGRSLFALPSDFTPSAAVTPTSATVTTTDLS